MEQQHIRRRMISGVIWLAATKAAAQAITWVITIVVVRLLAPHDYGLMGMAVLFTGFLLLFNDLGLGASIIQDPDLDADRLSHLRSAICFINFGLCLVLVAAAPLVAAYFREPALIPIVRTLGLAFILNGIGAPSGYMLARELAFKKKSRAEFFGSVSGALTTLSLAWSGFGVWSLILGYLMQQLTTNTAYCVYRPLKITTFSLARIAHSMNFGVQVASASILWYASSNADFTVVGRVLGLTQLGFYTIAFQFASLPIEKIVGIVTQVAFPSFSVLQNDVETLRRYYLKLVGVIALVTFPLFIGLFLTADRGIELLLTSKWTPVVVPLKILCVVSCLRAIETMNSPLVLAKGKPRIALTNNVLQAIVLPIAFYLGTRRGIEGVAIGWAVAWPVLFTIVTAQTLRLVGLTFGRYFEALKHAVGGSVAMVLAVSTVQTYAIGNVPALANVAITCVLGAITYLSYQWMFNSEAIHDVMAIVRPARPAAMAAASAQEASERANEGIAGKLAFSLGGIEKSSLVEVE